MQIPPARGSKEQRGPGPRHGSARQVRATTPPPAQGREVLASLRRITHALDLHSRHLVRHYGLTGPQAVVLQELALLGESAAGDLARAVSLSQATLTGILERLEGRGLIQRRRPQEDRRRVLVRPTPACRRVLRQAPPLLQESFSVQFARLEPRERRRILDALERLVHMMEPPPGAPAAERAASTAET